MTSSSSDAARLSEMKERAIGFAEGLVEASGLDIEFQPRDEGEEGICLAFLGPDARYLVGRSGQVLDALQYLTLLSITRRSVSASGGGRLRIVFDADDYRARREITLKKLASDLSDQVRSTGHEAVLDPLSAMERRIVHQALADQPGIRTYSEGDEPERYIVIAPA
jgi:spoIIIJ-associated protein